MPALTPAALPSVPALTWNVFDFGRIRGNVRLQDARLQQSIEVFQNSVLQAAREIDDAAISVVKTAERQLITRRCAARRGALARACECTLSGRLCGFSASDRRPARAFHPGGAAADQSKRSHQRRHRAIQVPGRRLDRHAHGTNDSGIRCVTRCGVARTGADCSTDPLPTDAGP